MKKDNFTEYQQKTIAHILDRFQDTPPARRMLCSDEVGLGKTFVAKGVIRGMALNRLLEDKDEHKLDVLYLCPNLNIAEQNKDELGIPTEDEDNGKHYLTKIENRSTMLYLQVLRGKANSIEGSKLAELYEAATGIKADIDDKIRDRKIAISIFPVTPEPSLYLNNKGDMREREYIIRMLNRCGYDCNAEELVKGKEYKYPYGNEFKEYEKGKDQDIDKKIEDFKVKLIEVEPTLFKDDSIKSFLENMKNKDIDHTDEWVRLRRAFAKASIQLIPYDLVIMDEFQNFTDIIQSANNNVQIRNYQDKQREMLWRFFELFKIDNRYKNFLVKEVDGLADLVEKDRFRLGKLFNECKDQIESAKNKLGCKWEDFEASSEGEEEAKDAFLSLLNEMLECESQENSLTDNEEWKTVIDIMETDPPKYSDEYIFNGDYYKITEDYLDQIYSKLNSSGDYYFWQTEYLFKVIGESISYDKTEAFYQRVRLYVKNNYECALQGVKKINHPYAEINKWAINKYYKSTDDGEKMFFRMLLMNLEIYRRMIKDKKSDIISKYALWKYLKIYNIDNRNISIKTEMLWHNFCFDEIITTKIDFGTDTTSELLDQIFAQEIGSETRILMLSATPFKMYLGAADEDEKIDGNKKRETVDVVCNFLQRSGVAAQILNEYKESIKSFASSDKNDEDKENVLKKKTAFEDEMGKYFTRMERNAVSRVIKVEQSERSGQDEEYVASIGELFDATDELNCLIESTAEAATYAKQIPYALSFMPGSGSSGDDYDGYKAKNRFLKKYDSKEQSAENQPVKSEHDIDEQRSKAVQLPELKNIRYSLLDKNSFDTYASFLGDYHGVFRTVLYQVLDINDEKGNENEPGTGALLWIPPLAVKQEDLKGDFKKHYGYGKSIIFSAWALIPRGLATLISYEVRRRLLCTIFPNWMDKSSDERKEILDKIIELNGKIHKELERDSSENEFEKRKRKRKLWHKLIGSDISALLAVWAQTCINENEERIIPVNIDDVNCHIKLLDKYSEIGRLDKVFEEYDYLTGKNKENDDNAADKKKPKEEFGFIKSSALEILFKDDNNTVSSTKALSFFARGIGSSNDDDRINAIKNLQEAFNSPFAPFVFATTSMGQEGLNFHNYADKVIHWNLPSNPVDFEQREGRINRRNCFVIRRTLIDKYRDKELDDNMDATAVFDALFQKVKEEFVYNSSEPLVKCGMIPNWILPYKDDEKTQFAGITRIVPYFSLDDQVVKYHNNLKILQLYRSVIGQPDPEELLERLIGKDGKGQKIVEELFLDFSPYRNPK